MTVLEHRVEVRIVGWGQKYMPRTASFGVSSVTDAKMGNFEWSSLALCLKWQFPAAILRQVAPYLHVSPYRATVRGFARKLRGIVWREIPGLLDVHRKKYREQILYFFDINIDVTDVG